MTAQHKANCPCGSKKPFSHCCDRYISGKHLPSTPKTLMRSRYSAYTLGNIAYIEKTMCGSAKQGFNADEAQQSAVQSKWLGLTILKQHQDNDTVGFVEFVARYRLDQKAHRLHECSEFHYIGDRWYYVDGKLLGKIN